MTPATAPWTRNIVSLLQAASNDLAGLRPVADLDIRSRFDLTMDALGNLAAQMAQASGRKNLVWVTGGVPLIGFSNAAQSGMDFTNRVQWFSERLEQSQIVVYTVQTTEGAAAAETFDELTAITGGREYSSSRTTEAVQQAITDSRANYEIGYYPAPANADSKHRKIRVTCGRKEVRLQTAHVFYPVPAGILPNGFTGGGLHSPKLPIKIDAAVHSPFDASEIGIRARVSPNSGDLQNLSSDPARPTGFEIHIDAADLLPRPTRGHVPGKVDVAFATFDEELRQPTPPLLYRMTPEQIETATRGGGLRYAIPLGQAVRKVRVIVFDEDLDAIGSVTIPIQD